MRTGVGRGMDATRAFVVVRTRGSRYARESLLGIYTSLMQGAWFKSIVIFNFASDVLSIQLGTSTLDRADVDRIAGHSDRARATVTAGARGRSGCYSFGQRP